ncbi:MAG: nitroreductase family protein [Muribaculaceae bacterium]|nr:nitroreductase family protein [Muribaculaceae bacterium]
MKNTNLPSDNIAYSNIIERTSIRKFTDQNINDTFCEAILHAAMSAPSGVNLQPWEFVVIRTPEFLKELGEALPYSASVTNAPIAILVCANRRRFLEGDDSTLWVQDVSAASENILLAAHALGLGAVWTCIYPHPDREDAVRRILPLSDDFIPFSLIPIGYPAATHAPINKWHPERVHNV